MTKRKLFNNSVSNKHQHRHQQGIISFQEREKRIETRQNKSCLLISFLLFNVFDFKCAHCDTIKREEKYEIQWLQATIDTKHIFIYICALCVCLETNIFCLFLFFSFFFFFLYLFHFVFSLTCFILYSLYSTLCFCIYTSSTTTKESRKSFSIFCFSFDIISCFHPYTYLFFFSLFFILSFHFLLLFLLFVHTYIIRSSLDIRLSNPSSPIYRYHLSINWIINHNIYIFFWIENI